MTSSTSARDWSRPSPGQVWLGARVERIRIRLDQLARTLRIRPTPADRPLPRVRIATGPAVPAWVLRLVLLALGTGCGALVTSGPMSRVLLGAGLLVVVVLPGSLAAAPFVIGVALVLAAAGPGHPLTTALLLAGLHLFMLLGALVSELSLVARVELRSLWPSARRYLLIQAPSQLLALTVVKLADHPVTVPWLPVLAAAGLTAMVSWLLPWVARGRR